MLCTEHALFQAIDWKWFQQASPDATFETNPLVAKSQQFPKVVVCMSYLLLGPSIRNTPLFLLVVAIAQLAISGKEMSCKQTQKNCG